VVNACDKAHGNSPSDAADIHTGAETNLEHAIIGPHIEHVEPRNKGATEEDLQRTAEVLTTALSSVGFASVRLERRPMKPVSTICAIGQK
jgi:hypothetical protein